MIVVQQHCIHALRRAYFNGLSRVLVKRNVASKTFKLKVLNGNIDVKSQQFLKGQKLSVIVQEALEKTYSRICQGGGEKAIHRHTVINRKILPRERLKRLFDDDTHILEIGPLAGLSMDYGDVPCAGGIIAIGKVNGVFSIGLISDATVKAGAIYPIGIIKNQRGQQLAYENHLPCVHMVDSAGAFLPLQADIFPDRNHGGRTFYNQAIQSEMNIPQIVLVCGSCTAGAAYIPTMAEQSVIVKDIGTVFLAGPPLVKAATGEVISSEELGGADLHCRVSGCTDYYAEDEQEAIDFCRDIILTCNMEDYVTSANAIEQPLFDQNELLGIGGQSVITKENVYQVLSRILDGSKFHEFKAKYGQNLITGFGFIDSQLVGILANSGPLTIEDAQKGTHLINLCDKRHIPLVFLQNSSPNERNTQSTLEDALVLKERGKMIAMHSCATVPKLVINIGGCLGDDNFIMCGESFYPNFLFSWPLAHTTQSHNIEKVSYKPEDFNIEEEFECTSSAFFRSSRMHQDGIILPQDTRKILSLCLQIAMSGYHRKLKSLLKANPPLLRM